MELKALLSLPCVREPKPRLGVWWAIPRLALSSRGEGGRNQEVAITQLCQSLNLMQILWSDETHHCILRFVGTQTHLDIEMKSLCWNLRDRGKAPESPGRCHIPGGGSPSRVEMVPGLTLFYQKNPWPFLPLSSLVSLFAHAAGSISACGPRETPNAHTCLFLSSQMGL